MTDAKLSGKRIAIIAADMVEQVELVEPRKALEEAGAETELISMESGSIQGFDHFEKADEHKVDRTIPAKADDGRVIVDADIHTLGHFGDAGIARRAIELVEERACRDLPGQRMFAAAGTKEKDIHFRPD